MVRHTLKILQHLLQDGFTTFFAALNPQSWERKIVMGKKFTVTIHHAKRQEKYCVLLPHSYMHIH